MLRKIKLGTKFNLLLLVLFLTGVIVSGVTLSQVLQQRAEDEVAAKALVLMETMTAVRGYTSTHINPLLQARLEVEPEFIPETVPAYSATEVFENLRQNDQYRDFFYKEAALNPTNLRDKADQFETQLVDRFREESNLKELSGFRDLPSGKIFYIARPLTVSQESCLRCHSTPDAAPKSQLTTYGRDNGFGWKLNEVVAAQTISVPAEEVFANAQRSLSLVMLILIAIFSLVILGINFLLRRTVIEPIRRMSRLAHQVSIGKESSDFERTSNDEIGVLADAFNRMKASLEISIRMLGNQDQK